MLQQYTLSKRLIKKKLINFVSSSLKYSAKLRKSAKYQSYKNDGYEDHEIMELFHGQFTVIPTWEQFMGSVPDDIDEWAKKAVGANEDAIVVVHRIIDNVPAHTDKMSKECFVIPIQYDDNVMLFEDDKMIQFKPGYYYSLNDYNMHGLKNPNKTEVILITVA